MFIKQVKESPSFILFVLSTIVLVLHLVFGCTFGEFGAAVMVFVASGFYVIKTLIYGDKA